jgi:hypothetical protein
MPTYEWVTGQRNSKVKNVVAHCWLVQGQFPDNKFKDFNMGLVLIE